MALASTFFAQIIIALLLLHVGFAWSQTELLLNSNDTTQSRRTAKSDSLLLETTITASLSAGASPLEYFIAVPVDPVSGESASFYIALKTYDSCSVNTTVYFPSSEPSFWNVRYSTRSQPSAKLF
jgi:hypothetical protein